MNWDWDGGPTPRQPDCVCGHVHIVHALNPKNQRTRCSVFTQAPCPCTRYQPPTPPGDTMQTATMTADLDQLDAACDIIGHIPEEILDYLEWILTQKHDSLCAVELRRVLTRITQ